MFMLFVTTAFALLLIFLSAMALHLLFTRAKNGPASFRRRTVSALSAGLCSIVVWGVLYSHRYLGW